MQVNSIGSINFGVKYNKAIQNSLIDSAINATRKGELKKWRKVKNELDSIANNCELYIYFDNSNKEEPIKFYLDDNHSLSEDDHPITRNDTPLHNETNVKLKKGGILTIKKMKQLISFLKNNEYINRRF